MSNKFDWSPGTRLPSGQNHVWQETGHHLYIGYHFAYIFFDTHGIVSAAHKFFIDSQWRDANVPKVDSEKAAGFIRDMFPSLLNSESNKDYQRPRSVSMRTVPLNSSI